jgi:lipoic acid synthetase
LELGLSYVVITMVDRDDLEDGGAGHLTDCVEAVKRAVPPIKIEVLGGDFRAARSDLRRLARSPADVLAHNIETVRSLTKKVRDGKSNYDQSLGALRILREEAPSKLVKSSIMLGLGEREAEVRETLRDLRSAGVDIVTLGQYLQPTPRHLPVAKYVPPHRFDAWRQEALAMGFLFCASGPLVRSSYKAGELFAERWLRARESQARNDWALENTSCRNS